jgi:excisionase family DNA binding protein
VGSGTGDITYTTAVALQGANVLVQKRLRRGLLVSERTDDDAGVCRRLETEGGRAMSGRELRTVKQAARDLAVSEHTIRSWVATRKIASIRLGRAVRIPASDIDRLIEQGTVPALDARIDQ